MTPRVTSIGLSPLVLLNLQHKPCYPVSFGHPKLSRKLRPNSRVAPISIYGYKQKTISGIKANAKVEKKLKPMWDDGYGTQTVKDYFEAAKNIIQSDGGPPRWFCPIESGPPLANSPLLLFLPGMDGLGMGLILHHKALGKVFEVRCMHIPVYDRTPYEGLMKFVENTVKAEHASFPNKPIYLVGDSFGGCLALSVAASNPSIDLVLILVNPATSFSRSMVQALVPLLEAFPEQFQTVVPYLFGVALGDPIKMANVKNYTENLLSSPLKQLEKLSLELSALLTGVPTLSDILPNKTLIWKLKLLKSAAALSNSHLHAVKSEVLLLASGKDSIFPSENEAQRLSNLLKNCKARLFKNNGHTLLMEDGINLLSIIKGTRMYRRSKRHDFVKDFIPPSMSEFHYSFDQFLGLFRVATSPATFSTLPDGKIVRGLKGVPDQGPVLLVGYHMLFGTELSAILEEFLKEKNVMVHGITHPQMFTKKTESPLQEISSFDFFKVFGAVPATASNFSKLLSSKSYVLLYPGGVREALHRKGEEYKLFWPDEPEFVRMAIRFGAKIVPFGVVGEDDLIELCLDYNDLMKIPHVKNMIRKENENAAKVRNGIQEGEVANQDFFVPGFYPKVPGRIYALFGKPFETKGREDLIKDKESAKEFYLQIKSEVERSMAYLIKKREEDPYRNLFERLLYRVVSAPAQQIPTFDP
ncbi:hypothetical protein RD792_001503 [Penstemon davidsonii]|uniref:AB hydrolase-1 domain-containing protein n=1 Tax=Penstemon davidsonii TaxID=160366 RepID=A0ABR0DNL3_9LAMI|nr:hypothetical protein RD792_001503 [Penstemon davidsonii]